MRAVSSIADESIGEVVIPCRENRRDYGDLSKNE
ncbi:unnamed protein product, partial [Rotaria magnacalcarata]